MYCSKAEQAGNGRWEARDYASERAGVSGRISLGMKLYAHLSVWERNGMRDRLASAIWVERRLVSNNTVDAPCRAGAGGD